MELPLFYSEDVAPDVIILNEESSRYALQVLRLKQNDSIGVTDGQGTLPWVKFPEVRKSDTRLR